MTTNYAPRNAANPFAIVSSGILRNPDLSSVECRVMGILLNLPQGWQPNAKHLSTQMREGTSAIQKAIARLKRLGYLVCRSIRDVAGRFLRSDWEINEIPTRPSCKNMDVRGNIVTIDRGEKAPKNLRREAKQRVKSGQKLTSKSQTETLAVTTFDPYTENPYTGNPNTGFSDRSNIDIPNIHLNLERETGFGEQEEGEDSCGDLGLHFDKKSEFCTQPEVLGLGKSSATAEFVETDLNNFKSQLEDLGKKLGRRSPLGWAFRIVQNLRAGKASTYWDEFKSGMPLGTSEQREWEIAPGVACSIAIQCLQQDYLSKPGTTPQEAALKAARTISRPNEMAAVWESIKSQVMFRRSEWERQSELGVQSPILDSWMVPRAVVSVEDIAIALQEIQSALPEVLKSKSELAQSQQLQALQSQEKSALTQNDTDESLLAVGAVVEGVGVGSVIGRETLKTPLSADLADVTVIDYGSKAVSDDGGVAAAAKAKITAMLSKFARPGKRAARLAANMAGVENGDISTSVKTSIPGGLVDYLLQIEVEDEEEIW